MRPTDTVVVSGATGFLGSRLCRHYTSQNRKVIALKRAASNLHRLGDIADRLTFMDLDDRGFRLPEKLTGERFHLIHTATNYGRRGESSAEIDAVNIALPLAILERSPPEQTIQFINIDTCLPPNTSNYARSKSQFLAQGSALAQQRGIPFTNVRMQQLYGPGDDAGKFTTRLIHDMARGVPEIDLTPGDQLRDFIYIDDAVRGIAAIANDRDASILGYLEFDLGTGVAVPLKQFALLVREISGAKTALNFGAVEYRANEPMSCVAAPEKLIALGWRAEIELRHGIEECLTHEQAK